MYIEFKLPYGGLQALVAVNHLHDEFRKWCSQHSIDYYSLRWLDRPNIKQVYMPSDRALELWALSWNPTNEYLKEFTLRR